MRKTSAFQTSCTSLLLVLIVLRVSGLPTGAAGSSLLKILMGMVKVMLRKFY